MIPKCVCFWWNLFLPVLANPPYCRNRSVNFLCFIRRFKDTAIQQLKLGIDWPWLLNVCFVVKKSTFVFPLSTGRPSPVLFCSVRWIHRVPWLKMLSASVRTNKAKSPGVSRRRTQGGQQSFPGVQGGGGREVLLGLLCCWAGDHSLKKSRPTELEVTVFFSPDCWMFTDMIHIMFCTK